MGKPVERMTKEELIQEVYRLARDAERLNFLQGMGGSYGLGWACRRRSQGGFALHETSRTLPGVSTDIREAIDSAISAAQS